MANRFTQASDLARVTRAARAFARFERSDPNPGADFQTREKYERLQVQLAAVMAEVRLDLQDIDASTVTDPAELEFLRTVRESEF